MSKYYKNNDLCTQHVLQVSELTIFMNNLSSYCGLVDAKIRTSDKDLPVNECNKLHDREIVEI